MQAVIWKNWNLKSALEKWTALGKSSMRFECSCKVGQPINNYKRCMTASTSSGLYRWYFGATLAMSTFEAVTCKPNRYNIPHLSASYTYLSRQFHFGPRLCKRLSNLLLTQWCFLLCFKSFLVLSLIFRFLKKRIEDSRHSAIYITS